MTAEQDPLTATLHQINRVRGFCRHRMLTTVPTGVPQDPNNCPIKRALQCYRPNIGIYSGFALVEGRATAIELKELWGTSWSCDTNHGPEKNGRGRFGQRLYKVNLTDDMTRFVEGFDIEEFADLIDPRAYARFQVANPELFAGVS